MSGMKKRVRELEADIARLQEQVQEARELHDRREAYRREQMARWGAPHIHDVVSREGEGVFLAHQIVWAEPTPQGLRVEIAKTRP